MNPNKLANPYLAVAGYDCFGCSPENPAGLAMQFEETERGVRSVWTPGEHNHGYPGILHGGVQATLVDECASWYVFVKLETSGVTAALDVRYHKPVRADAGPITIEAIGHEKLEKRTRITVEVVDAEGELCTTGYADYAVYSPAVAKKRMHYPGAEAFRATR